VYSINYPLSPENNFPDPVIATIRALAHIKAQAKVNSVVIMGDSAGGAVASTVTAVLSAEGMCVSLSRWLLISAAQSHFVVRACARTRFLRGGMHPVCGSAGDVL
jgi:acetyl esterase/lipase